MPVKPTNWNLNNKVLPDETVKVMQIMNQIKLYGKPIRVNKVTLGKKNLDVSASLFIGNLDSGIGEKMLYDTFSTFGITSKIA
ncbi:Splicing factor 3B subunit 4 [Rhizophagus irregularis]|uniref:Splicing factor 3B subunit 4 n=1 Tax=Rhizophagus irregularis TaxID=588596 RepID=UPI00332550A0|nr:Splicing factor 3B subunit 4 [Rhizophagus irregularis]